MAGQLVSCGFVNSPLNRCLDSSGYRRGEEIRSDAVKEASNIRQAAAIAIAADNAARLIENYRKQRDIARRSVAIAEKQQKQLQDVYWPREEQFLAEFSEPEELESVEVVGRRYAGRLQAPIAAKFAEQIRLAKCNFRRYCTSANKKVIQDLMMARGVALANARLVARQMAFAEYQARSDVNFKRRQQAVAWGRGLVQQSASLYASAGQALARAGASLSSGLTSALEWFGYAQRDYSLAQQWQTQVNMRFGQQGTPTRMPGGQTSATAVGANTYGTQNNFGFESNMMNMTNLESSNTIQWPETQMGTDRNPFSSNQGMQIESWNTGRTGDPDLARTGIVEFPVIGVTGGFVLVNMDQFPLMDVNHKDEGETTWPAG